MKFKSLIKTFLVMTVNNALFSLIVDFSRIMPAKVTKWPFFNELYKHSSKQMVLLESMNLSDMIWVLIFVILLFLWGTTILFFVFGYRNHYKYVDSAMEYLDKLGQKKESINKNEIGGQS